MTPHRRLAMVSGVELAAGVVGMAIAVRRRHQYDFLVLHGTADHVARDTVLMGTAFSAPATMLVAQAVAAGRVWRGPSRPASLVLAVLGIAMVPGYLGEKLVRRRMTCPGYDRLETPLVIAGMNLLLSRRSSHCYLCAPSRRSISNDSEPTANEGTQPPRGGAVKCADLSTSEDWWRRRQIRPAH